MQPGKRVRFKVSGVSTNSSEVYGTIVEPGPRDQIAQQIGARQWIVQLPDGSKVPVIDRYLLDDDT